MQGEEFGLRDPQRLTFAVLTHAHAPRLDAHVGRQVLPAMSPRAGRGGGARVQRLQQVLDNESGPAQAPQKLFPAVQKLQRALLA